MTRAKPPTFADRLRTNLTSSELKLWEVLRDRRMGIRFESQVPLPGYVVDFYCAEALLAVEVDGEHHYGDPRQREYDRARTERLNVAGIEVLRFGNDAVREQMDYVIWKIADRVVVLLRTAGATDPARLLRIPQAASGLVRCFA